MSKVSLKFFNSLAAKLIVSIAVIMMAGGVVSGLMFYNYERGVTLDNLTGHASFISGLMKRALHHGMLQARRDSIQSTITSLGTAEDVREILVVEPGGKVVYASVEDKVGGQFDGGAAFSEALAGRAVTKDVASDSTGTTVVRHLEPLMNEASCAVAACHFHPADDRVLGVLVTSISAARIDQTSRRILSGTLLVGGLFIVLVSIFLFFVIYKYIMRPISVIELGIQRVQSGDYDHPIDVSSGDELGRLAGKFNSMSHDIKRYRVRLEDWAKELEAEVEKKAVEIRHTQEQLSNAEKLASLGRLAAGVAHEINNPLTGIVTFAHLMLKRTPTDRQQDIEDLDMIIEQADRCTKIIKGLLGFSRKAGPERTSVFINDLVRSALAMVKNQSMNKEVDLVLDLAHELPRVTVDTNQIQQVIINLFTNAADAMNGEGRIEVRTRLIREKGEDMVEIAFADSGPGIMPEHLGKIFEPFFTTKSVGKGTGLGLPVSYGIIKRHGGDIVVKSQVGRGTTFFVRIPLVPPTFAGDTAPEALP